MSNATQLEKNVRSWLRDTNMIETPIRAGTYLDVLAHLGPSAEHEASALMNCMTGTIVDSESRFSYRGGNCANLIKYAGDRKPAKIQHTFDEIDKGSVFFPSSTNFPLNRLTTYLGFAVAL